MDESKILKEYVNERQECEVWTRVMGYFRPVSCFNMGKKGEYHERVSFKESKNILDKNN
ncbi:Anaerobic ribonucleoside-triphosphate reductase [uncultured archaeon]|nr:Anaerobic ribonucleoside-triphosphate reductase [uncultured archaeon]